MTPQEAIAARKEVMQSNNAAVRALTPIVAGQTPWNAAAATEQANVLVANAQKVRSIYPDGSFNDRVQGTRALPAITARRADFNRHAETLEESAQRLVQLARGNDEGLFKAQFPRIGQTCSACHNDFRSPQQ